jgi:TrwC relaxase
VAGGGGIDVTFSAPKSVSAVWALGDPWQREQIEAEYRHTTARGVSGAQAPDPQLHSHVVITGAVREDERFVAVASRPVFRSARELGAFYRSALAGELAREGYGIEQATGPPSHTPNYPTATTGPASTSRSPPAAVVRYRGSPALSTASSDHQHPSEHGELQVDRVCSADCATSTRAAAGVPDCAFRDAAGADDLAGAVDHPHLAAAFAAHQISCSSQRRVLGLRTHRGATVALSQDIPATRGIWLYISLGCHRFVFFLSE